MRTWLQYFFEGLIVVFAQNWIIKSTGLILVAITTYFWLRGRGVV